MQFNRWKGIVRPYTEQDVQSLQGNQNCKIEYTLAKKGAEKLWDLLYQKDPVRALGAVTGNQAIQQVRAGLKAIYISGWQVAADANESGNMYPDQSLYPANSVPELVKKINKALQRADQIEWVEGSSERDWFVPLLADAEAGFGGVLNAFEMMKNMIEAGASGVHYEDQLSSEKKCGHLGGKVLIPTNQFIRTLVSARLAADVLDTATILIARTDANSARLLTSDIDEQDHKFFTGEGRTPEGFYKVSGGLEMGIARGLAYAPYADLLWLETSTPDLGEAKEFADEIHEKFPDKLLAYNCSPSFNWKKHLDDEAISKFQTKLGEMGYKFQFITLAGFHALNYSMFNLASNYKSSYMSAYTNLQQREFDSEKYGYTATKHQREVGTGYFDKVSQIIMGGNASTLALKNSTEEDQFK